MRRYRILILPTEYPEAARPHVVQGEWTREQARALSREHEVAVLYATPDPASVSEESWDGDVRTKIVAYRHWRKTWLLSGFVATWRALRKLGFSPDCIHAHGLYPAGLHAIGIGRSLGIPVVVTEHWGQLDLRSRGTVIMKNLLAHVLRRANAVVAVSNFLAAEMVALEPRCRPAIVTNTVHPGFFKTPIAAPRVGGRIQLLFVGGLNNARKGLENLLGAIGRIAADRGEVPFHLTVVGDGAQRIALEKQAAALPKGSVQFRGALPAETVVTTMAACDAFVMPSTYETFGVVFAEAMAAGKPVIGCMGTAAEEIVPSFAGVLVRPNDADALAAALLETTGHLDKYDGAAIRAHARQHFSHESFLQAMQGLYDRVLNSEGRRRGPAS